MIAGAIPWDIKLNSEKTDSKSRIAFASSESEDVKIEDPRLDELLPAGWKRVVHDDDHLFTRFENLRIGEVTDWDPRVSYEILQERGIKF